MQTPPAQLPRLTNEDINRLPLMSYEGPIHLVRSQAEVRNAVRHLAREKLLGFDTETRPSFRKGESYPPALLQLAAHDAVYLFQLTRVHLPAEVTELLATPRIIKAGVAIQRDIKELRALRDFTPRGFVDLGEMARAGGIPHSGLRGLAALLLGGRISKSARLTRWDHPHLPHPALVYAATDAWLGRRLYEVMQLQQRGRKSVRRTIGNWINALRRNLRGRRPTDMPPPATREHRSHPTPS